MTDSTLPDTVKGTVSGVFTRPLGGGTVTPRIGWVEIYPNVATEGERITVLSLGYAVTASRTRITLDSDGSIGSQGFLASTAPGAWPAYIQYVFETHFTDHGGNFTVYFDVPLGSTVDLDKIISDLPRPTGDAIPFIAVPTWPTDFARPLRTGDNIYVIDSTKWLRVTNPYGSGLIEGDPE